MIDSIVAELCRALRAWSWKTEIAAIQQARMLLLDRDRADFDAATAELLRAQFDSMKNEWV